MRIAFLMIFLIAAGCSTNDGKTCLINETQPCLGPGGCSGVQTCVDGASFTRCTCGAAQDGAVQGKDGILPQSDAGVFEGGGTPQNDANASNPSKSPKILSLTSNISSVSPGQSLIISAIVTDPQGIADLIGGKLEHPKGGTYGTFATSSQEGAYSLTLDWKAINTVAAINAPVPGTTRVLRARFYDVAGHETTKDLSVKLICGSNKSACTGVCVDLQTSLANCGKCGFSCSAIAKGAAAKCESGACELSRYLTTEKKKSQSCSAACSAVGFTCSKAAWVAWCCKSTCPSATCSLSSAAAASTGGCTIDYAECICVKTVKP